MSFMSVGVCEWPPLGNKRLRWTEWKVNASPKQHKAGVSEWSKTSEWVTEREREKESKRDENLDITYYIMHSVPILPPLKIKVHICLHHGTAFIFGSSYATVSPEIKYFSVYTSPHSCIFWLRHICIFTKCNFCCLLFGTKVILSHKQSMENGGASSSKRATVLFAKSPRHTCNRQTKWWRVLALRCVRFYVPYFQITQNDSAAKQIHPLPVLNRPAMAVEFSKWIMNVSLNMHWFLALPVCKCTSSLCRNRMVNGE